MMGKYNFLLWLLYSCLFYKTHIQCIYIVLYVQTDLYQGIIKITHFLLQNSSPTLPFSAVSCHRNTWELQIIRSVLLINNKIVGRTLPADWLVDPRLVVVAHSSLLLWIPSHVRHRLQVSALRFQPLVDEQLGIFRVTQEELPAGLQAVDRLHGLVDLVVQRLDLLLGGGGQQEVVHLSLESVVNLEDKS